MIEEVAKNVFFIQSAGSSCNSYFLVGSSAVLIDSGLSSNSRLLVSSLKEVGFSPEDIDLILHTHGHADHFCADSIFPKAKIRMSEFDALKVSIKDSMFSCSEAFGETFFPKIHSTFSVNELVRIPPFNLQVIPTPGHTEGSVCFLEKSLGLLFSGDTVFSDGVGRFDLISGSKQKLSASIQALLRLGFETLLPGHGGILKSNAKQSIKNSAESFF